MNESEIDFDKNESVFEKECELIISSLLGCEFYREENNRFFLGVQLKSEKNDAFLSRITAYRDALIRDETKRGARARAYTGDCDFGHTSAGWRDVITLGIFGLRNRIGEYKVKYSTKENEYFYIGLQSVYDGYILR